MKPTAEEYRIAARVIRYTTQRATDLQDALPPLQRWWSRLTRESSSEDLRKSAILEAIADKLDEI